MITLSSAHKTRTDDLARQCLIEALRDGSLQPGQRIFEPDLLALTGLGRTPLRQALTRLQAEGLLRQTPGRKGYLLPSFSEQDRRQLFIARRCLELTACEEASRHRTEAQLDTLRELNAQEELFFSPKGNSSVPDKKKLQRYAALNEAFHRTIFEASHNPYLLLCFEQIFWRTALYPLLFAPVYTGQQSIHHSRHEHGAIIDALEQGDRKAANIAMELHLERTEHERSPMHELYSHS